MTTRKPMNLKEFSTLETVFDIDEFGLVNEYAVSMLKKHPNMIQKQIDFLGLYKTEEEAEIMRNKVRKFVKSTQGGTGTIKELQNFPTLTSHKIDELSTVCKEFARGELDKIAELIKTKMGEPYRDPDYIQACNDIDYFITQDIDNLKEEK